MKVLLKVPEVQEFHQVIDFSQVRKHDKKMYGNLTLPYSYQKNSSLLILYEENHVNVDTVVEHINLIKVIK